MEEHKFLARLQQIEGQPPKTVKAGEVLVQLDTRQEEAQLAAAESQQELARLNLSRMGSMLKQHVVAQAEYDRAAAEAKQAEASAGEIRATIARKTIRAPFAGVVTAMPTPNTSPKEFAPTMQGGLQWSRWGMFVESKERMGEKCDGYKSRPVDDRARGLNNWRNQSGRTELRVRQEHSECQPIVKDPH